MGLRKLLLPSLLLGVLCALGIYIHLSGSGSSISLYKFTALFVIIFSGVLFMYIRNQRSKNSN